jgi:hypothetical protein
VCLVELLETNGKPQTDLPGIVREEARVNGHVHGGHATCGSGTRASPFLIGLVTCSATRDDIVARAAWRR